MYLDEKKTKSWLGICWNFALNSIETPSFFSYSQVAHAKDRQDEKETRAVFNFPILQLDFSAAASLKTLLSWSVFSDWYTRQGEACNCMEKSENFLYHLHLWQVFAYHVVSFPKYLTTVLSV